ncbi:PTS system [Cutibacterium acnes JCM 18909]|nr:PTS system [Cutibacterium acnes JCM 18909]
MRAVVVPALFNISEPIMFGLPVMMNPFFYYTLPPRAVGAMRGNLVCV